MQMQDDGTSHYYYALAADHSIDYHYQFCTPNNALCGIRHAGSLVDTVELKRTITQLWAD